MKQRFATAVVSLGMLLTGCRGWNATKPGPTVPLHRTSDARQILRMNKDDGCRLPNTSQKSLYEYFKRTTIREGIPDALLFFCPSEGMIQGAAVPDVQAIFIKGNISGMTEEETKGLIGHEIWHLTRHRDPIKPLTENEIQAKIEDMERRSGEKLTPFQLHMLSGLIQLNHITSISRERELEADEGSVILTEGNCSIAPAVSALKKTYSSIAAAKKPVFLSTSHLSLEERIGTLEGKHPMLRALCEARNNQPPTR